MDQAGQVRAVTADELTLAGLPGHPGRCGLQRPADRHVHLKLAQPLTGGRHRGHRDTTLDRLHPEVVTGVHRTPRNRGRAGAPGHHRASTTPVITTLVAQLRHRAPGPVTTAAIHPGPAG